MRRRETFATSGPRIQVRLFGGALPADIADQKDPVAAAYLGGVPMGGVTLVLSTGREYLRREA